MARRERALSRPSAGLNWRGAAPSWWVTLRAPHVARRLLARADWPAAGQDARYDVELPGTSLRGNVLDQAGAAPGKGTWIVLPQDGTWWGSAEPPESLMLPLEPPDPDAPPGEFLVRGLPAETLTLRAEGPGKASQPVTCAFSAKGEARATPLVLREVVRARIRLLDARGALDWAHVLATPVGTRVGEPLERSLEPTDAMLALELPGDTEELALALADREGALHLARLAVRDRERAALRLPDATSRLRLGQFHPGVAGRLFLLHDGGLVELQSLRRLGVSSSLDPYGALRLSVPPGHYTLCALTTEGAHRAILTTAAPAGCAEGSVTEGEELSLSLATRR